MSEKTAIIDLYEGRGIDIWTDDDQDEPSITNSVYGRVTINLDREDFQELCNGILIAKQTLKDLESRK